MVDLAPQLVKTKWMKHEEVEYWSDESGRIVLVGEAAHPWFVSIYPSSASPVQNVSTLINNQLIQPGGTHGPAMALEDAVVLGTLFGHLKKPEQISAFVNAFQEIREDRTKVVNNVDVSNAKLVRLPPGPERDARDSSIRQSRKDWDDGTLRQEFEGVAALFAYEAPDAAMVSFELCFCETV